MNNVLIFCAEISIALILLWTYKYFESKATNRANKEDIGTITDIVETIKHDLVTQGDLIKAQLSHKSRHDLELKSEERNAYFELNKHLSAWLYAIIRFSFTGYSIDNYKELKTVNKWFSELEYNYDLSDAHLSIFNQEKQFHELKLDLIKYILKAEHIIENNISKLYYAYSECDIVVNSNLSDFGIQSEARNNCRKQHSSISAECHDDFIAIYPEILNAKKNLDELIKYNIERIDEL